MTHNPRTCPQCSALRHPALARDGRALAKHLAENPLPQQKGAGR